MTKNKKFLYPKLVGKSLIALFVGTSVVIFGGFILFNILFLNKIFPGVHIAYVDVGGKTQQQTTSLLKRQVTLPADIKVIVDLEQPQSFSISLTDISLNYDFDATFSDAFAIRRFDLVTSNPNIPLRFSVDEKKLTEILSGIAANVSEEPTYPSVKLTSGQVTIQKGKKGQEIDLESFKATLYENLRNLHFEPIQITLNDVDPRIDEPTSQIFKQRAEKLVGRLIKVNVEEQSVTFNDEKLIGFLWPTGGYNQQEISAEVATIRQNFDREPQNSKFIFENGRAKEFSPTKDGIAIKTQELHRTIMDSLTILEDGDQKEIVTSAPLTKTPPLSTDEQVSAFGIKEQIGKGTSRFKGSIPSRIYNVGLATSRINGVLVAPGETFSFNEALGDVSKITGYKEAYVIKDGKTVLGDGGGVCQVSTTLFRAVLNAGLPISERRGHAYRVGYYEQDSPPGLDATVYSPTTDFKFTNDTANHILIQATADTKNASLVFELYGTKDGRVATLTKPVQTDVIPPAEDLYTDDPTLAAGVVKQVEHKAWGAKVTFTYTVAKDGENIYKKTFVTNYRPWQAVYLRGTGPTQ